MTSIYPAASAVSFDELCSHLKSFPVPLLPPGKPIDASLSDRIASLYLHPALEALLHILNHDLPSAHFLVRHMQSAPAFESMYLHGILHRIEGDFNNTRAWYCDVAESEPFELVWGKASKEEKDAVQKQRGEGGRKLPPQHSAQDFVDRVERLARNREGDEEDLSKESRREINTLLDWCIKHLGTQKHVDASQAWVQPSQEISSKGQNMVTGTEGFRKF